MINNNLVKYNFYSSAVCDIIKALQGGALTGAYILSFCCIDYMGLALNPSKGKNVKTDFISFLKNYMSKINSSYINYAEHLYTIRCSLVHSYGPSDATGKLGFNPYLMFDEPRPYHHLRIEPKNSSTTLYLVLPDFVSDLITSITLFFENIQDPKHYEIWNEQLFYETGIRSVMMRNKIRTNGGFKYGDINPILGIIDDHKDFTNIRIELYKKINEIIKPFI